jgi:hypothetical protein
MITWFKVYYFELVLRDEGLFDAWRKAIFE